MKDRNQKLFSKSSLAKKRSGYKTALLKFKWFRRNVRNDKKLIKTVTYVFFFAMYLGILNLTLYGCCTQLYLFSLFFTFPILMFFYLIFIILCRSLFHKIINRSVVSVTCWLLIFTIIFCYYQGMFILPRGFC